MINKKITHQLIIKNRTKIVIIQQWIFKIKYQNYNKEKIKHNNLQKQNQSSKYKSNNKFIFRNKNKNNFKVWQFSKKLNSYKIKKVNTELINKTQIIMSIININKIKSSSKNKIIFTFNKI